MKVKKIMSLILLSSVVTSVVPQIAVQADDLMPITESDEAPGNLEVTEVVAEEELILKYDINQDFNGTSTTVDLSEDISQVEALNDGAIYVEFNTESTASEQVLFSVADTNDSNSYMMVKLLNGKVRYEVREAGTLKLGYTNDIALNDGEDHKIIINNGQNGSELYIDGTKVYTAAGVDSFFNDINTLNNMTVGAVKTSLFADGVQFFNGNISQVRIYGSELEQVEGEKLTQLNLAYSYIGDRHFNGTSDLIDASENLDEVKDLNEGSILIDFETSSTARYQTLLSMADSNESDSHLYLMLHNGKLRYEVRENGRLKLGYTVNNIALNDGKQHKIMVSNSNEGSTLYIDGEQIYSTNSYNMFFNDVMTPDTLTVGAMRNAGYETSGRYFFNGNINSVDILKTPTSEEEAIQATTVMPSVEDEYERLINTIHNEDDINILYVGDSITHGAAHTNGYRAYVDHIDERITGELVDGKMKENTFVINAGNSSGTTRTVLDNFEATVENNNPDIMFLTLGMNDCRALTASEFEANLKEIITKTRELGAQVVLQTTNDTRTPRANFPQFMEIVRKVGEEMGVYVIDQYQFWLENQDKKAGWLNDSIHPNQYGHLEIAKFIMRELQLDTEDSFTYNLEYPLSTEGEFVDTSNLYQYPDYVGVEGIKPVVSYKVDSEVTENKTIDLNDDIEKVSGLTEGSIVARFNLTNDEDGQTIISLSHGADRSSNATISLNQGELHYEVREGGNILKFTTTDKNYNDGEWHTVVLTTDAEGTKIYVDGEVIMTDETNAFFGNIKTPDNFHIGKNVDDSGSQWFYNGKISYVDIYSDVLTEEQAILVSAEEEIQHPESMNLDAVKAKINSSVSDSWVFIGDEDTSSNGDTLGYRDYTEHFEERVRWELANTIVKRTKFMPNTATDGLTSTSMLANFDRLVTEFEPEVVSVMLGAREDVSVEEFEANLREIVSKIEEIGAVPFLQTPTIKSHDTSEYMAVIRKVAEDTGVAFVDHYEYWKDVKNNQPQVMTSWLNEEESPNHRGHLEIAKKLTQELGIYGGRLSIFEIPYEQ